MFYFSLTLPRLSRNAMSQKKRSRILSLGDSSPSHSQTYVNEPAIEGMRSEVGDPNLTNVAKCWIWAVLLFVCWQPFELGFYMDDWAVQADFVRHGGAFSMQRFRSALSVDATRPGLAVQGLCSPLS